MSTLAFVYKWTQLSTGKWYIGSRTAKGCNPMYGKHHTDETKQLISKKCKEAAKNRPYKNVWVSPDGSHFNRLKDAHAAYPSISETTIRVWSRANKNGWSHEEAKQ